MHQELRIKRLMAATAAAATAAQTMGLVDHVIVDSLSKLPVQGLGNDIQLADNTAYQINGTVSIGDNHLIYGIGTVIVGVASQRDVIVYTGTGAALRAAGGANIVAKDISIVASVGAMFDGNGCASVLIDTVAGIATKYGRFENCTVISLMQTNCSGIAGTNAGIELVNAAPGARFAMVLSALIQDGAGTGNLIDLGSSVWASIAIELTEVVSAPGGTDISGLIDNGNLVDDIGRGRVQNCVINGEGTHLENITLDDILWVFDGNTGLANSVAIGVMVMADNLTATTIGAANTMTKVEGNTTLPTAVRHDDGGSGANNNLRSVAKESNMVLVDVDLEITKIGATKLFNAQVFKSGSPIGVVVPITVTSGSNRRRFRLVDTVAENDAFELRIENTVDDNDATVTNMDLIVSTVA